MPTASHFNKKPTKLGNEILERGMCVEVCQLRGEWGYGRKFIL